MFHLEQWQHTFSEFNIPSVIRENSFGLTLSIFHAVKQFTLYANNRTIIKESSL
jgi:hypothetical protein